MNPVVGQYFRGPDTRSALTATYRCTRYLARVGYHMLNIDDPTDEKDVSERAIGGTFNVILPQDYARYGIKPTA